MEQKVGYCHLKKHIGSDPHLSEERKQVWEQFEKVRNALYIKYREFITHNRRLTNNLLESAIREITCSTNNSDTASVVVQWRSTIERYTHEEKFIPLKTVLTEVLNQYQGTEQ